MEKIYLIIHMVLILFIYRTILKDWVIMILKQDTWFIMALYTWDVQILTKLYSNPNQIVVKSGRKLFRNTYPDGILQKLNYKLISGSYVLFDSTIFCIRQTVQAKDIIVLVWGSLKI